MKADPHCEVPTQSVALAMASVCALVLITATACSTMAGYPDQSGDTKAELTLLQTYWDPKTLADYAKAPTQPRRDEIVGGRIRAIDLQFGIWQLALVTDTMKLNTIGDITSLAVTTTATITSSVHAKTILSAIATALTGAKATINKDVFYDKTVPALLAQMIATRKQVLVRLRTGLSQELTEYSLNQALSDVDDYYTAGTIPAALAGITETAGKSASEATKKLETIATYGMDAEGLRLYSYWKPTGKVDDKHATEIRAFIESKHLTIGIPTFIITKEYHDQRVEALDKLKVP